MGKTVDIPDSARSWAVAMAGCLINSLLSGFTRSTGVMYVALIETLGVSRFQANLPFSVRVIVKNLGGPVVGALGQRFGPRNVTLAGGVLAALGMVLCAFAPNIIWITFLCGGVHGVGVSMASTLGLIMVTHWFIKHKATGTGIAFSGSCFGSLIFPFIIEKMLDNFGLFGCFILIGGLTLNILPAALLMKNPSWMQNTIRKTDPANIMKPSETEKDDLEFSGASACGKCLNASAELHCVSSGFNNGNKNYPNDTNTNAKLGLSNPTYKNSNIDIKDNSIKQVEENESTEEVPSNTLGDVVTQQETSVLKAIITISRDPMFYMISLSIATFSVVLEPIFIVLVDLMMDKGLTVEISKYFISAFSLGDLVGRLCFGWVTDRKLMSVKNFMLMMQILHGACLLLLPVFYDFYTLMSIVTIFGVITGASLVMIPILIQKYFPSVQSLAIGCVAFLTGTANMIVPSLIGYFRDEIGSYNGMIYILGGVAVFVGSLWVLEPLLLKLKIQLGKNKGIIPV